MVADAPHDVPGYWRGTTDARLDALHDTLGRVEASIERLASRVEAHVTEEGRVQACIRKEIAALQTWRAWILGAAAAVAAIMSLLASKINATIGGLIGRG